MGRASTAAAVACALVLCAGPPPASAAQLRGVVLNDVFQLHTVGTAGYTLAPHLPPPHTNSSFVIFSGQILDAPEAIPRVAAEMAAVKAAGGQIIRFTVPWPSLETDPKPPGAPPSFNPLSVARLDAVFAAARNLGLKVDLNFNNTTCTRSSMPNKTSCSQLGWWSTYPPANVNDYTEAVRAIANRWGADIHAIEVWNEPNIPNFFMHNAPFCDPAHPAKLFGASGSATRAAAYVPLVKAAWQGVKTSSHPKVLIVAGGTSLADTQFLQNLYTNGMQGYYDAISVHPYQMEFEYQPTPVTCSDRGGRSKLIVRTKNPATNFSDPTFSFKGGVEAFHSVMQQHGDTKPIWITEFGFNSCSGAPEAVRPALGQSGPNNTGYDWSAICVGWGYQADWLADSFKMAARWPYLGAIMAYQTKDPVVGENQFSLANWGLLRHDMSPKLAYVKVQQAWSCLAAGTC